MQSRSELDRLLVTLDVDVQTLAFCELRRGRRLIAPPVEAIMIHYVLAGNMHMTIDGSKTIISCPGSIVLIPPAVPLHVAADDDPSFEVLAVEQCVLKRGGIIFCDVADGAAGDLRYVSGIVLASFSGSFGLFDKLKEPISQPLDHLEFVQQAYEIMLNEMSEPSVGARALISALMKACLILVVRQLVSNPGPQGTLMEALPDPRFSAAIAAVLDRPADHHSLQTLAASAGMSRSRFSATFRDAFEMSPMEFVAKTRLHHAAQLLRSTPLQVKVIAGTAGFASRSHFSQAFKAAYGIDPSAFREKYRNGAVDPPPRAYARGKQLGLGPSRTEVAGNSLT